MSTADCPAPMELAGYSERVSLLGDLPKIMAIPGGYIVGNYLLYQGLKSLRQLVEHSETVLKAGWFERESIEGRIATKKMLFETCDMLRVDIAALGHWEARGLVMGFLMNRVREYFSRFSDLVETVALSADPEMVSLGKELSDVL